MKWTERKEEDGDGEDVVGYEGLGVGGMRNLMMWQWQPVGVVKGKLEERKETAFWKRGSLSYMLVHARYAPSLLPLSPFLPPLPLPPLSLPSSC